MAKVKPFLFNSALETGLRALMLLVEAHPKPLDIQRLVVLDYLLVHSADIDGGPASLHPANPLRAGEVSIRRGLLEDGLHLFASKGFVSRITDKTGICYLAEETAVGFLDSMSSEYAEKLRRRAQWAVEKAIQLSDKEATTLLEQTIGRWKTEFVADQMELEYEQ